MGFFRKGKSCVIVVTFEYGIQLPNKGLSRGTPVTVFYNNTSGDFSSQFTSDSNHAFIYNSIKDATYAYNFIKDYLGYISRSLGLVFNRTPNACVIGYKVNICSSDLKQVYK